MKREWMDFLYASLDCLWNEGLSLRFYSVRFCCNQWQHTEIVQMADFPMQRQAINWCLQFCWICIMQFLFSHRYLWDRFYGDVALELPCAHERYFEKIGKHDNLSPCAVMMCVTSKVQVPKHQLLIVNAFLQTSLLTSHFCKEKLVTEHSSSSPLSFTFTLVECSVLMPFLCVCVSWCINSSLQSHKWAEGSCGTLYWKSTMGV